MVRSLWILLLIVFFITMARPARVQTAPTGEEVSLAKALEGLSPGPRIAYLEYLLKTENKIPEVYFQLGVAFHDEQRPDSALIYYAKAAELDPRFSKAFVNMGVILDEEGRPQEALRMFDRAIEAKPEDLLAHAHAAYLLLDAGEYETAWSHLSRALAIDSLHPQPHFYLAIFFWESGMFRESLAEWEKVVELAPGGDLAKKAQENITILQEALTGAAGGESPVARPVRRTHRLTGGNGLP